MDVMKADVAEIYTPPRFTPQCGSFGLRAGFCVDLSTEKPNGEHWDLTRDEDKAMLKKLQTQEKPEIVIGSPPCTDFCTLLRLRLTATEVEARRREGAKHVETAAAAYRRQLDMGKHFLHEHPAGSASWDLECMRQLAQDSRVYVVTGPQCRWGLKVVGPDGKPGYVRKRTTWMTSSKVLADLLDGSQLPKCQHRHVALIGGRRTQAAAVYPLAHADEAGWRDDGRGARVCRPGPGRG